MQFEVINSQTNHKKKARLQKELSLFDVKVKAISERSSRLLIKILGLVQNKHTDPANRAIVRD